ncbi:uncharacterized protein A1O9_08031 [Exophiala aquamarina CBS 119918]|uniref:Uncharacterized protein n=1 Tax=Exophiala aquamarina CBS 119918 TaxID=1182545 RepID=A0A072PLP1_9EURO|nr:uncharacterized protein A1O9_08031 [Exophiala aquamarina CBS 119918]KEF56450.1 hypothetical protein A1O9_08031 [Exophiala aquamarina CBS 119918]
MWSTAASWVALLALTAALTRYYNPDLFRKLTGQALSKPEQRLEPGDKPAAKRQKAKRTHATRIESTSGASTPTSANEGMAKKRRKLGTIAAESDAAPVVQSKQPVVSGQEESEMSNKLFAQQLAKTQAGTKLEPAKPKGTSKKERRATKTALQAQSGGQETSGLSTETSSTTGGRDADDDFSPVGSPSTGPVSTAPTSRADDVSDMLEAPAAKPTTLRLTDVKDKVKSLPKSVSKAFEPVMTKKQRQRQAKQAEERALKAESDRVHDAKKQQQLRTARTAAGTSNQVKADSFTAKQNAWNAGAPTPAKPQSNTAEVANAPLLDTFEREKSPSVKVNGAVQAEPLSNIANSVPATANANQMRGQQGDSKTDALGASSREKLTRPRMESQSSWADEVNEEEQNKWASELAEEEKWESVTTKKGKKKGKKDNETSSEASSSFTRPTPVAHQAVTNGNKGNAVHPQNGNANRFASIQQPKDSSFQDAEWEA